MLKHLRRQEAPPVYALNGAVFVVRREVLDTLENQFTIERFVVSEMPRERSVDIDSADDLALAEWYLSRRAEGR
jgi:CMP-N-acetylneuraminic acid synthetase